MTTSSIGIARDVRLGTGMSIESVRYSSEDLWQSYQAMSSAVTPSQATADVVPQGKGDGGKGLTGKATEGKALMNLPQGVEVDQSWMRQKLERVKLCNFLVNRRCDRGEQCGFAHRLEDLSKPQWRTVQSDWPGWPDGRQPLTSLLRTYVAKAVASGKPLPAHIADLVGHAPVIENIDTQIWLKRPQARTPAPTQVAPSLEASSAAAAEEVSSSPAEVSSAALEVSPPPPGLGKGPAKQVSWAGDSAIAELSSAAMEVPPPPPGVPPPVGPIIATMHRPAPPPPPPLPGVSAAAESSAAAAEEPLAEVSSATMAEESSATMAEVAPALDPVAEVSSATMAEAAPTDMPVAEVSSATMEAVSSAAAVEATESRAKVSPAEEWLKPEGDWQ